MESLSSRRRPARRGVAGRLAATRAGAARRAVIVEMLASVVVRVWPDRPEVGEPGREAWVARRQAALLGQLASVRERRERH